MGNDERRTENTKKKQASFELASSTEIESRQADVDALVAIIEPDPEFRPYFLSDEASVFEVTMDSEEEILARLTARIGKGIDFSLHEPLWRIVDHLNATRPDWRK